MAAMGYLDQLKDEARALQDEQTRQAKAREENAQYLAQSIHPRMQALYTYLSELTDNLNIVKPQFSVAYDISGFGVAEPYVQQRYKLTADSNKAMMQLSLTFFCESEQDVVIEADSPQAVQRQKEYFFANNVRYRCNEVIDERQNMCSATFTMAREIPVVFKFTVNAEKLDLSVHNFIDLGVQRYPLKPEQLDEDFFDRLAGYIVRDRKQFMELEISQQQLEELRANLEKEQAKQAQDLQRIARKAHIAAQRNASGKVKAVFSKAKKKLFDK